MNKLRFFLILAIVITAWFVAGDRIVYEFGKVQYISPCFNFGSTVKLWRQREDKLYVLGNGVYLGNNIILTNSHLADKSLSIITTFGVDTETLVLKIVTHPDLDLAILVLNKELNLPPAKLANNLSPVSASPYTIAVFENSQIFTLFAGNYLSLENFDQFLIQHNPETLIIFNNFASKDGYSGGALLDSNCRLIGLVVGGNRSAIWGLKPKSFYVNLTNEETRKWLFENIVLSESIGR